MNSRERVLASLNHHSPDRVAVDFGGHRSSGIMAIGYIKLREFLGLPKRPPKVYDVVQQLAIIDDDVLDLLGVDVVELGRGFCNDPDDWKPWLLPDGSDCFIPAWVNMTQKDGAWIINSDDGTPLGIQKPGMLYFDQIHWPLMAPDTAAVDRLAEMMPNVIWAVATPPGPVAFDQAGCRFLAEGARRFRASTDRAIVGLFGGNLLEWGQFLMRNDNFFMALASEPAFVERLLDKLVEIHLTNLEKFLGAVGSHIDVILFGDDLGMQRGPQISPDMYRRFFKPRHAILWQTARKLAPVKVMLHSCGGIYELLPDLIEAGLDAVNPVQISCDKMRADVLKREFGGDITFWGGGCDTHNILPLATPEEVSMHVQAQLNDLAPGGGFVFQQVHNIMSDVPPVNVKAMFDAIRIWDEKNPVSGGGTALTPSRTGS